MLFQNLFTAVSLLVLASLSDASALKKFRRASESDVSLYCYAQYTNGGAIFYDDGLAYFKRNVDTVDSLNGSMPIDITFTVDTADTTVPWSITANSSTMSFNSTLNLYIVPTDGAFTQVGFASADTLPTAAVNTGFAFFGKSIAWAESDSNYELQFWGSNTTTEGIFGLYWNAGADSSVVPTGAFPVTVKTTAPINNNGQD